MKQVFTFFFFFFSMTIVAQDFDIQKAIAALNNKIEQTQNAEKLKWLDSLTLLIRDRTEFKYDSVAKVTIDYALFLDSSKIATRNLADLIYYKCAVMSEPDEGISIYNNFNKKNKTDKNNIEIGNLYLYVGDCFSSKGNAKEALISYKKAKKHFLKYKDKSREAIALLRISFAQSDIGLFAEASQNIQQASKIFIELKDTLHIINSKNALSILYSQNAFYKEAKKERDEAILLAKNRATSLVNLYYNAATDARMVTNNKDWIHYLKLTFNENEKSEYKVRFKPNVLSNLVIAYAVNDSINIAEEYLTEYESNPKFTKGINKDFYVEALKQINFAKHNYTEALKYGKEHLQLKKDQESFVEIYNAEKFLADVYNAKGEINKANRHLNNYYSIKDSISSIQNVRTLTYYQTIYETEKRDLKIEAQKNDIILLDVKNKVKNQWLLFGGLSLLGLFSLIYLWRSNTFAKRKAALQKTFSQDLINAQEEERTRVARDLHDSVGQQLMLLARKTKSSGNSVIETLATNTLSELRTISQGLHPASLDRLGFTTTIQDLIDELGEHTDMFISGDIENIDDKLNEKTALHLYRIIQELLSNIIKHAEAKAASVTIETIGKQLHLTVKDNGKGFNYQNQIEISKSLGMKSLLERCKIINATFNVKSTINSGSEFTITIPT